MRKLLEILVAGLLGASLACFSAPPQVVQGKVVSYDDAKKQLVLEDEAAPHPQRVLDTTSAEFGAPTAPGNLVRVAYHDRQGRLFAGRVMNLTAQKTKK